MSTLSDRVGVLIIGQTPREDLMAPLKHLSESCQFMVRGALDGVQQADLPIRNDDSYPLVTRLRDGTRVTVDEHFLTPLLQAAIDELEREEVIAVLLLCAGPFSELVSTRPLIRPFQLATLVLKSLGLRHVCVVVPTNDQRRPAEMKWKEAGLEPIVISVEETPFQKSLETWLVERVQSLQGLSAVVIDYVGYPIELLQHLQTRTKVPVIDMGHLAVTVAEALLAP